MTAEQKQAIEIETFSNISNFVDEKEGLFFDVFKNDIGYTLQTEKLKYRIEKNNIDIHDTSYCLVVFEDSKEIKFSRRPIKNGDSYDEIAIKLEKFVSK